MEKQQFEEFLDIFKDYNSSDEYDKCWNYGKYIDQYCPCCPYRDECSGYEDNN